MKNVKKSVMALVALGAIVAPTFASAAMLTRQLDLGVSGADVSSLQSFLAVDTSIYPEGLVTGYFGPLTQKAVSNFQARNSISVVGRVGPITLAAINAQMDGGPTVGYDRQSPTIRGVSVSTTNTNAIFNWTTSEAASALVYYSSSPLIVREANVGMGVNISGSTYLMHTDLRTTHSGTLTGLQSNTTYYYIVYVRDASGNVSVTTQSLFQTGN